MLLALPLPLFIAGLVILAFSSCTSCEGPADTPLIEPPACDAGDEAFVTQATLAILGRRPRSHAEIELAVEVIARDGRRAWALELMQHPGYVERWSELVLDNLYVPRTGVQSLSDCYGDPILDDDDGTALAEHVLENDAQQPFASTFSLRDLLQQSLRKDDVSPVYRAHLFALLTRLNACVNVDPVSQELAFRDEVGHTFEAAYLNRDPVCLACHTTSFAVTDDEDPAKDRHWPLRGRFEESVFGAEYVEDPRVPRAVFRVTDFVEGDGFVDVEEDPDAFLDPAVWFTPWGADASCGSFARDVAYDDPAEIDAHLGTVRGARATVLQVEQALRRGVDELADNGLSVDGGDAIADADAALAYLVAMNVVDNTWRELIGTPLTIATHFPRNQAQRDQLQELTDRFVASHFSLRELIADVVTSPYANIQAPEAGCGDGASAFSYPAVYDPWVRDDPVEEARNNSAADAVHALSARTLLSASYAALGWRAPASSSFPEYAAFGVDLDRSCFSSYADCAALDAACEAGECCVERDAVCSSGPLTEVEVQRGVGVFHGISEKGFRGLDFQARLFFESRFGRCQRPGNVERDVVDELLERDDGSVRDVVQALKERITNDASLAEGEADALSALLGDLDVPATRAHEDGLRTLCGALLASPQFQLAGIAPATSSPAPLQPSRDEICAERLPGCR